jgi:predicted NUDIX family NTP pyrophosphohydrolase
MAAPVSAGVLAWRRAEAGPELLLVHPGGPYWRGKDEAAWSIPKGLAETGEDLLAAARREFAEELGLSIDGALTPLTPRRLPGGKWVHVWLVEADLPLEAICSNLFEIEWPPRSGRRQSFPEVDAAAYMPPARALTRIHRGQQPILLEALAQIGG